MALDLESAIQAREDQITVFALAVREQIDEGGVSTSLGRLALGYLEVRPVPASQQCKPR